MSHSPTQFSSTHIVPIRKNGVVIAHQLRVNGGGPGNTRYYSAAKLGSPENSLRAAQQAIKELGLPKPKPRGGSPTGRVLSTSKTKAPGICFVWAPGQDAPRLLVVATWVDKKGKYRSTSYSVEANGLEVALDRAIKARTSAGAEAPDKVSLLRLLRKQYRSGPPE